MRPSRREGAARREAASPAAAGQQRQPAPGSALTAGQVAMLALLVDPGRGGSLDVEALLCSLEQGLVAVQRAFGPSLSLAAQNDARNVRKVRAAAEACVEETAARGAGGGSHDALSLSALLSWEAAALGEADLPDPSAAMGAPPLG